MRTCDTMIPCSTMVGSMAERMARTLATCWLDAVCRRWKRMRREEGRGCKLRREKLEC